MPFDATDPEIANLEMLCHVLETSETFSLAEHYWTRGNIRGHECGTPACILGHAWDLWDVTEFDVKEIADRIGVNEFRLTELCYSWHHKEYGGLSESQITGRMAAAALRRLRHEGEVRYDLADA